MIKHGRFIWCKMLVRCKRASHNDNKWNTLDIRYTYDSFFHISPVDAYFFVSRWMLPMFTIFFSHSTESAEESCEYLNIVYTCLAGKHMSPVCLSGNLHRSSYYWLKIVCYICVLYVSHTLPLLLPASLSFGFFCCLLWFCFHLISMLFALWASFCVHIIHLISSIVCITLLSSS